MLFCYHPWLVGSGKISLFKAEKHLLLPPKISMSRAVFTFGLIILVLLQPICRMGILAHFRLNQEEISRTICIMRAVKDNSCKGRCQLKKQLKKIREAEKRSGIFENLVEELQYSGTSKPVLPSCFFFYAQTVFTDDSVLPVLKGFLAPKPHPPAVAIS
jgi:hypothetical protein